MKIIELKPIKESTEGFQVLEKRIKELWRRELYLPIMAELSKTPKKRLENSKGEYKAIIDALHTGRITFYRGTFSGRFNASITRELRGLGATWDRRQGTFKVPLQSLPPEIRAGVAASEVQFQKKLEKIDKKLGGVLPEEIAAKLKADDLFDRTIWKTETEFQKSVKGITVAPQLTPERRRRIADEWQNNMQLYIQEWTETEIKKLRREMKETVFAGNRYESAVKAIQSSYGVSASKAKFLARQETNLLMTKFKQARYTDSGVDLYRWRCVAGSANHPVRPSHKACDGKIFTWTKKREVDLHGAEKSGGQIKPGQNNDCNAGQDYNCRCFAVPIVQFRE